MGCPGGGSGGIFGFLWLVPSWKQGKKKRKHQLLIKSCGLELMNSCLAAWVTVRDSRLISCKSGYSSLASWAGYWRWWVGFLGRWPKAVDQSSIFTDGLVSVCNAHCCFPHNSPNCEHPGGPSTGDREANCGPSAQPALVSNKRPTETQASWGRFTNVLGTKPPFKVQDRRSTDDGKL